MTPSIVKAWAESQKATFRGTRYCATLSKTSHGLTVTYWAVRIIKGSVWGIKEACSKAEDGYCTANSDLYFAYGGGSWVMVWEDQVRNAWKGVRQAMDAIYASDRCPNLWAEPLFGDDEIHALCPETARIEDLPGLDITDFVKRLKENPLCELVYKNETTRRLWDDSRLYRLGQPKLKKALVYLKRGMSFTDSLGMVKYGTKEKMERERALNAAYRRFKWWCKDRKTCLEMCKYTRKQNEYQSFEYSYRLYADYLDLSERFGRDLTDRGVLFPRNLEAQHDNLVRMSEELADAKRAELIQERADKYLSKATRLANRYAKSIGVELDGLTLSIPKTTEELVRIGNELHICVGVAGYDLKVAKGESVIVTVNKNGKPVECCELNGKATKILQLRGAHNRDSKYHDQAKKLIGMFIANNKPQRRAMA